MVLNEDSTKLGINLSDDKYFIAYIPTAYVEGKMALKDKIL